VQKEARKLISVQASSGSDRHSDDVPELQDKVFKILVCCPAILIFRGGFSLTFPSGWACLARGQRYTWRGQRYSCLYFYEANKS